MNKTEYIGKLNALYVGEKNCLEELITAYDEKDKEIERLKNGCKELEQQIDDLYKLETTLTNENERLNNIINKAREYIEEKYDYILGDDTFLDHDERIDRKQINHIIEILKGE